MNSLVISDISTLKSNISELSSAVSDLEYYSDKLVEYQEQMRNVWGSDTVDKTSYMQNSDKNIEVLNMIIKAIYLTKDFLLEYIERLDAEVNN